MKQMNTEQQIAQALLSIGAVGFRFDQPITFVSGIVSPVYVDNRKLPYHPKQWRVILEAMRRATESLQLQPEVIAGIESAGIPHSSALGLLTNIPSVFVRKKPKDHGTKSKIEGGDVAGKSVLLIEDMATTGGSSLRGVQALREAGGVVTDCIVITSYGFPEAEEAFADAQVHLHVLCPFADILDTALAKKQITKQQHRVVHRWMNDPRAWKG